MNDSSFKDAIHVRELKIWAHVGVLEKERLLGQRFSLDFTLWLDVDLPSKKDELSLTADYSTGIELIQKLSFKIRCLTIEHFSDQILNCLEEIYGKIPMMVKLRKCSPPINGFSGYVEVERYRNFVN